MYIYVHKYLYLQHMAFPPIALYAAIRTPYTAHACISTANYSVTANSFYFTLLYCMFPFIHVIRIGAMWKMLAKECPVGDPSISGFEEKVEYLLGKYQLLAVEQQIEDESYRLDAQEATQVDEAIEGVRPQSPLAMPDPEDIDSTHSPALTNSNSRSEHEEYHLEMERKKKRKLEKEKKKEKKKDKKRRDGHHSYTSSSANHVNTTNNNDAIASGSGGVLPEDDDHNSRYKKHKKHKKHKRLKEEKR